MSKISFLPYGGVGEIGANCMLVKTTQANILIDAGLLFPDSDHFGLDYLHPNFSSLQEDGLNALVLTHAHEDHLGAVVNLLNIFPDIPIYGPLICQLVLRKKFPALAYKFHTLNPGATLRIFDLEITSVEVNHSIPQTTGIHIGWKNEASEAFSFFYASDFKVDLTSTIEPPFNFDLLKKLSAHATHRVVFADSTNILQAGKTPSESEVLKNLQTALKLSTGRTFLTLFSSNIFRLFGILNIAFEEGRCAYLIGRSSFEFYQIGLQLGFKTKATIYFDLEDYPNPNGIFIVSGCQGDYRGAFRRLVAGEIKNLKLSNGDQVLYSAKAIPGNEEKVTQLFNQIVEQGCTLVTPHEISIHASGHPYQEDLRMLYREYNPTVVVPIHGESYFLTKHTQFLKEEFPQIEPKLIFNGQSLSFHRKGEIQISTETNFSYGFIHQGGTSIDKTALSQRRKIAAQGIVILGITLSGKKDVLFLDWLGLPEWLGEEKHNFVSEIDDFLHSAPLLQSRDRPEAVRIFTKNIFKLKLAYSPIVIVKTL